MAKTMINKVILLILTLVAALFMNTLAAYAWVPAGNVSKSFPVGCTIKINSQGKTNYNPDNSIILQPTLSAYRINSDPTVTANPTVTFPTTSCSSTGTYIIRIFARYSDGSSDTTLWTFDLNNSSVHNEHSYGNQSVTIPRLKGTSQLEWYSIDDVNSSQLSFYNRSDTATGSFRPNVTSSFKQASNTADQESVDDIKVNVAEARDAANSAKESAEAVIENVYDSTENKSVLDYVKEIKNSQDPHQFVMINKIQGLGGATCTSSGSFVLLVNTTPKDVDMSVRCEGPSSPTIAVDGNKITFNGLTESGAYTATATATRGVTSAESSFTFFKI
ncbi:MAG: hypothetical protein HPY50_02370 [Firmicutes bacterium]|nr:hypothetical protein [Bacillota bacterium]